MITPLNRLLAGTKLSIAIIPSYDPSFIHYTPKEMNYQLPSKPSQECTRTKETNSQAPLPSPRFAAWSEPACWPRHSPEKPKDLMEMINQGIEQCSASRTQPGRRQYRRYAQEIISQPPIDLDVLQDAFIRVPRYDSVQRFALTHWICYRDLLDIRSYRQWKCHCPRERNALLTCCHLHPLGCNILAKAHFFQM